MAAWMLVSMLVCMYCMYDYVFWCMYACTCSPLHTYISERYIILFLILNFSLLATRFSLDWLHRSFSSTRWAAEKGSWTQQWKLRRQGRLSYVCICMYVCMYICICMYICMYLYVCMYVYMYLLKCGCIYGILIYPSTYSFYARMISNVCMHVMYSCMHTKKIITTYTVQSKDAQSMQSIEMHKLMR